MSKRYLALWSKAFLLLILCLFSVSCKHRSQSDNIPSLPRHPLYKAPLSVSAQEPFQTSAITYPAPKTIVIPPVVKDPTPKAVSAPGSQKAPEAGKALSLSPPEVKSAGFYVQMPNYNTEQGLTLSSVSCGCRDHSGNLWFGTYGGGVSRYDGKSFSNFTSAQGLPNNNVYAILEDKNYNIWFATYNGGICRYDGKAFKTFSTAQGLASNQTLCLAEDKQGMIWIGTYAGLSRYDGKIFTNYSPAQGLAGTNVFCITTDKAGHIWLGTLGGGISCFDGKTFSNFTSTQGLAGNKVFSIGEDNAGNIWAGTDGGGLSRYDGKTFHTYTTTDGLASNYIRSLARDNKGNMWFGTFGGGMSRYDGHSFTTFSPAQGLAGKDVLSITSDKAGNLWLGTSGGGISRYDGRAFTIYTTAQGLPNNNVRGIGQDHSGNLWFGTYGGGVTRFDGQSFTNYNTPQGLPNNNVFAITPDKAGNIWFGTYGGGASRFDGKSFTNYTVTQGLAGNNVLCITEDKAGLIWFGTENNGLSIYDGKKFSNYNQSQGLANNSVRCIIQDKTGNMWLGTAGGGLVCFHDRVFTSFSKEQGLPDTKVTCITEDNAGNLWCGTSAGGIGILPFRQIQMLLDKNTVLKEQESCFIPLSTKQGLPDDAVTNISAGTDGTMYVGTNHGITIMTGWKEKNGTTLPASGMTGLADETPLLTIFNQETGFPVKDVNTGQHAMFIDNKGIVWAGTGDTHTALVRFDPSTLNRNSAAPLLTIQSIKINEENICWYDLAPVLNTDSNTIPSNITEEVGTFRRPLTETERDSMRHRFAGLQFDSISRFNMLPENLSLPYSNNNIAFEFAAIEPARPFRIRYQYMLEGYDKTWSPVTHKTNATFGNMYEGTYAFRLKACSAEGIWSAPLTYTFKVLPPWYRTWWAYALELMTISLLLLGAYRWRTASLRKDKEQLEHTVIERTEEVMKQKAEAETQRELADSRRIIAEEQRHVIEIQKMEVEKQKHLVEDNRKEILDSITYAKRLQQAILPSIPGIHADLPEAFVLYLPKDIIAGDFYWMHTSKDTVLIAAADCTGHGVPGALVSIVCSNAMNRTVNEFGLTETGAILDKVTELVLETFGKSGEEIKDGMDISLLSINTVTKQIQWSGANNPLWLVRDGVLTEIKADKQPVGKSQNRKPFTSHHIPLKGGEAIYLITDGYADQFGASDKKLMKMKFKEFLLSIQEYSPTEQQKRLQDFHIQWKGKSEQTDDITVIGIRVS